jgi:hypothetical protein
LKISGDPKSLGSYIACLSMLENKVCLLYKILGDKVESPLPKSLLLTLSSDSKKHSIILNGVSESIAKIAVRSKDCEKNLGEVWYFNSKATEEIEAMDKVTDSDLSRLAGQLDVLESSIGEEYYVFIQMQTLQLLAKEINQLYNINIENLRKIFSSIIDDEERHREILAAVKKIITQREGKETDNAPLFKYKNPDSWMSPMRSKE